MRTILSSCLSRHTVTGCKIIKAKFASSNHSTIIPERLDPFINKYAEHTHDKWAFEKVELFFFFLTCCHHSE